MTRDQTTEALVETAKLEFLRHGFDGTDVNRIARRAGFSTTTFYRRFKDKIDIFIVVYNRWADEERLALRRLTGCDGPAAAMVDIWVDRQQFHAPFRRSVRRLGHDDPTVRRAVADARLQTVAALKPRVRVADAADATLAMDLIQFEQLACALAEGELTAMGLDDNAARERLAGMLKRWRGKPPTASEGSVQDTGVGLIWIGETRGPKTASQTLA